MHKKMSLHQKYNSLSPGKKRRLRDQYMSLFFSRRTFYYKILGQLPLLKAEKIFFDQNL